MIGNDIVDLVVAQIESNWQRKGFLDKIFTQKEQLLISNAINPVIMVWNLWSRKEAAYKIYNRETAIRGYFPLEIKCNYEDENSGTVAIKGNFYYTKTILSAAFIHTIAVSKKENFKIIRKITLKDTVIKTNGIPFVVSRSELRYQPASISHHGQYWEGITITDND